MANRRDFFFRQKVTEAELDAAMAELEAADRALASDLGLIGVAVGMAVSQQVVPNLTVQVGGPGVIYDQTGQRIAIPSTQTVNCAVDEGAISTTVATPGNNRYLSIFAEFDRALSDPRVDGNSATVYFVRTESFQFNVVKSAEAGSPVLPPLRSDQILIADIIITFGTTGITNGMIATTRREWMFKTSSGTSIAVGTAEEAIQALATAVGADVTALAAHLADTVDAHDASAISFSPTGLIAATDVQTALAEVSSEKLALAGGTMTGSLNMGGFDITNGDDATFDDVFLTNGQVNYSPGRTLRIRIGLTGFRVYDGGGAGGVALYHAPLPTVGSEALEFTANSTRVGLDLGPWLREGMVIDSVRMAVLPGAARATLGNRMSIAILRVTSDYATPANNPFDPVSIGGTGGADDGNAAKQIVTLSSIAHTVVRNGTSANRYVLVIKAGNTATANPDALWDVELVLTDPGPRN
jgi:hypothetical protein